MKLGLAVRSLVCVFALQLLAAAFPRPASSQALGVDSGPWTPRVIESSPQTAGGTQGTTWDGEYVTGFGGNFGIGREPDMSMGGAEARLMNFAVLGDDILVRLDAGSCRDAWLISTSLDIIGHYETHLALRPYMGAGGGIEHLSRRHGRDGLRMQGHFIAGFDVRAGRRALLFADGRVGTRRAPTAEIHAGLLLRK